MAGWMRVRLVAAGVAVTLLSGCWLQVGYGPEHRRFNDSETGLTRDNVETLSEDWSVTVPGTLSEPIVDGGRVFTARATSQLDTEVGVRAFDIRTGATVWDTTLFSGGDGLSAWGVPVSLSNGVLWGGWIAVTEYPIPPAGGGEVHRLDPANGDGLGEDAYLGASNAVTAGSDVIQNRMVMEGNVPGPQTLVVRDAQTLATKWSQELGPQASPGIPTVARGRIYVARHSTLYGFEQAGCGSSTCPPVWTLDLGATAQNAAPVAGEDGQVFVATGSDVVAVDGATGTELWRAALGAGARGLALAGDVLYVTSGTGLQAFEAGGCGSESCTPLWTAATSAALKSAPTVAGGVVYVGVDGAVDAYDADGCDAATCSALTSVPAVGPVTDLSVAQGKVFAVSPGRLTALAPA